MEARDVMLTSGFNFDGYKVVKYSGFISADSTRQIDGFRTLTLQVKTEVIFKQLEELRKEVIAKLKEYAVDMDCNAIIGLDFEYLELPNNLMPILILTGNGNAVVIEKG